MLNKNVRNPRQMVKEHNIMKDKKYNDIFYAYLQSVSKRDNNLVRYVPREYLSQKKLATKFNVSRNTVTNRVNALAALGLVEKREDGSLILRDLKQKEGMILPKDLLEKLVDTLTADAINTYVYLFNRYYANQQTPLDFTVSNIIDYVGIRKTEEGYDKVSNILVVLNNLNLIKTSIYYKDLPNGIKVPVHKLSDLRNYLDDSCEKKPDAGESIVAPEPDKIEEFDF